MLMRAFATTRAGAAGFWLNVVRTDTISRMVMPVSVHARTRPVSAHCRPGFGHINGQNPADITTVAKQANLMPQYAGQMLLGLWTLTTGEGQATIGGV
jgi:hypothetical protein